MGLLLALSGCLPPAPAAPATTGAMERLEPINPQETLAADRAPALRGQVRGDCPGVVRLEARSPSQARPLAATTASVGDTYALRVPSGPQLRLRWGCDADSDGVVPGELVSEVALGAITRDVPLDLRVAAASDNRVVLVAPSHQRSVMPGLPPTGAVMPQSGALAPPDAPAPADGAVGPPLPDGPPADAGPPPPAGTPPPP